MTGRASRTLRGPLPAIRLCLCFLLLALLAGPDVLATGMRVQPGGVLLQNVPVGQRHRLRMPLTVFNDDDEPHAVAVSALRPSEVNSKCPVGYEDIPEPGWLSFSEDTVEVPANGTASVGMFIEVPGEDRWKNQHWSVSIAVRSRPGGGQALSLALYPRFEIESVPDAEAEPPAGQCSVVPSVVEVAGIRAGSPAAASLVLWNRTEEAQRCTLRVLAKPQEKQRPVVALSGGMSWMPDASWVALSTADVILKPGEPTRVGLKVAVPAGKENGGGAWEAVVLVEFEKGPTRFCRLRVRTLREETPSSTDAPREQRGAWTEGG